MADDPPDEATEGAADRALIDAAIAAMARAYCPYSNFPVGAAVRTDSGAVHAGCNVENSAYPQGWCAEASAIAAMVGAGERRIVAVAVAGTGDALCTPCGGCRQKLREFAGAATPVHVCGPEGLRRSFTLGELLPEAFGPGNLGG